MTHKPRKILSTLTLLTSLFILTQLLFFGIHQYTTGLEGIARSAIVSELLFSKLIINALSQLFIAQLLIYGAFIYVLWYLSISIAELLALKPWQTRALSAGLWTLSIIAILFANTYWLSHSFFSKLLRHYFLSDALSNRQIRFVLIFCSLILLIMGLLAVGNLCLRLYKRQNLARHGLFLCFLSLFFVATQFNHFGHDAKIGTAATASRPNIFIIGFDALRPDYLSFFNPDRAFTPNFDKFLQGSVAFTETYTPLARTFPSWATILTSQYPLHHQVREDSTDLDSLHLSKTLATALKEAGYETLYASDERRFSNINESFGFDRAIGPDGTIADFLIATLNDFPLSNLLIPTAVGELLFPYNYANHGSFITYDDDNFLDILDHQLQHRNAAKPLFLAVHFNQTAWPFYWFNDQQPYNSSSVAGYQNSILKGDELLAKFLAFLEEKDLLQHALLVVLSDHGMTLALPGERNIAEKFYQGDKSKLRLKRTPYSEQTATPARHYGLDTSYGYGSDVLSLKQYHPLLAFKAYGLKMGTPHLVSGRASLLDVAPTVLALLHLPALKEAEGLSLQPYLMQPQLSLPNTRALFFESGYSVPEIEQDGIIVNHVIKKSINLFQVDDSTGLVYLNPASQKTILENKQRAILQGPWLLAYYPSAIRHKILVNPKTGISFQSYIASPYQVLVNLETGKWTTEMQGTFAESAPLSALSEQLHRFYGEELKS